MFWSISMNSVLAFGMVLIFLYSVGDVDEIANSTYPLMNICLVATNSVAGASAMLGAILCTIISGTIGSVASTSRLTWAWARDGVLPAYFAHVDPHYRIPVRSVWYVLKSASNDDLHGTDSLQAADSDRDGPVFVEHCQRNRPFGHHFSIDIRTLSVIHHCSPVHDLRASVWTL